MSPALAIAQYLEDQYAGVIGASTGWAISVALSPDTPHNCITVYDTGGEGTDTNELDLERPTFQVRVRSFTYTDAWNKQDEIRSLLQAMDGLTLGAYRYTFVRATSDILSIGTDDRERYLTTANYRAMRQGA